jgi:acyl-CoA synthetase (AMP-forming)/AMP-acid ligase II
MNKWNLEDFLYINTKYKPDIFPGSPYMYIDIINADLDKIDISTLRMCDSGGDSLPIECIKKFEEKLGIKVGEQTEDNKYALCQSRCLGCCGLAPVISVNGQIHGKVTEDKVDEILSKLK